MDPIEKLLAELRHEYSSDPPALPAPAPAQQAAPPSPPARPAFSSTPGADPLAELKSDYEKEAREAELRREREAREAARALEEARRREKARAIENAEAWLKKLNPKSDTAQWFLTFARDYPSKVEAAIHYLEAMREVGLDE